VDTRSNALHQVSIKDQSISLCYSSMADEPRDALRHFRRVVNKGGSSVWETGDSRINTCGGRRAVARKAEKNCLRSELGTSFHTEVLLLLKIPEFP